MASPAAPSGTACAGGGFSDLINCGAGAAVDTGSKTISTLLAAIAGSLVSFAVQLLIFLLLRLRLSRIYRPRSYLVPERERVPAPPPGIVRWLGPLFTTPNLAFIQKCGLDAYFFLRYLRMLLKLFLPISLVVLPILLPLNRYSGDGTAAGLDELNISNIAPQYRSHRLWAHLILAIGVVVWFCYVVYKELRGYIRVRQAYLTSPQHRIRASATTVLVTGIPRKWLTLEALSGLYDVFPGGIKNIWINRNFDELSNKVDYRTDVAKNLESAETNLIKMCRKKHEKALKENAKREGMKKKSKVELKQDQAAEDAAAEQMAQTGGISAGDQGNVAHGLQDVLHEAEEIEEREHEKEVEKHLLRLGVVGEGLDKVGLGKVNQGLGAVGAGFGNFGRGVGMLGQRVVGDVDASFRKAEDNFEHAANSGNGFVTDDALYRQSVLSQSDGMPTPTLQKHMGEKEAEALASNRTSTHTTRAAPAAPVKHLSHPFEAPATIPPESPPRTGTSEKPLAPPELRTTRPSVESRPQSSMQIEEPAAHLHPGHAWQFWKNNDSSLAMPSPQPHTADEDEFPLTATTVRASIGAPQGPSHTPADQDMSDSKWTTKFAFWKHRGKAPEVYPAAINKDVDEDVDGEPRWRHYLEPKDRETIRLPIVNQTWFPSIPFVGQKVDRIYHLRRELARLNLEIETDQADVEKFPHMNSAFIQFNHQVAAHMACQSLSHHVPQHMAPRLVEISPDDVLWDNMSIKWWERYLRTALIIAISAGLIVLYAVPVTFTSLLSKVHALKGISWLAWLNRLPTVAISIIQGLLPPLLLSLILLLVPIIFRLLVKQQGVPTGNAKELGVQSWYFAFLFIQVFLVVTLSNGLTTFFVDLASHPNQVVTQLAANLPRASSYFYSYLFVQALSNSASALLQTAALFFWFIIGPLVDVTPRAKWRRQTTLNNVQWGTFFPPFTNFAVIGIIYSIIAPFILPFMLVIFALFWVVYRYNVLYVYQFRNDTGGLLFPTAINQLFTGIYFLELCLIGFFFISEDPDGNVACIPQGAIMIVVAAFTALYQWQINRSFDPLFQYLPITLEDEAVVRDEEFARAQASKFAPLRSDVDGDGVQDDEEDIQDVLAGQERRDAANDQKVEARERRQIGERRRSGTPHSTTREPAAVGGSPRTPTWKTDRWRRAAPQAVARLRHLAVGKESDSPSHSSTSAGLAGGNDGSGASSHDPRAAQQKQDVEAQHTTVGDVLFSGFADELEDLTTEERDLLVRYAFQHTALRAKRPVVWIPRDRLGVSDDEIRRAERVSTVSIPTPGESGGVVGKEGREKRTESGGKTEEEKTFIWMSNEGTALDGKGRAVFRRSPPDFQSVDLIAL